MTIPNAVIPMEGFAELRLLWEIVSVRVAELLERGQMADLIAIMVNLEATEDCCNLLLKTDFERACVAYRAKHNIPALTFNDWPVVKRQWFALYPDLKELRAFKENNAA